MVDGVEDDVPLRAGVDRGGVRRPRPAPLVVGPRATTSRPGIGAGSPCHSQPTRPGMPSPSFMPVPAKSQWSGLRQIQSPAAGDRVDVCGRRSGSPRSGRARVSGPCRGSLLRLVADAAEEAHARDDPARAAVGRGEQRRRRRRRCCPTGTRRSGPRRSPAWTLSYISSDQYSSWPTDSHPLARSRPAGSAWVSAFEMYVTS